MKKFIGEEVEVLIEETVDGYSYGHTGNFLHVKVKGELPHNEILSIKIIDVEYPYCIGEK
jgi:tRNA A37 methylthiotransferase MiaB